MTVCICQRGFICWPFLPGVIYDKVVFYKFWELLNLSRLLDFLSKNCHHSVQYVSSKIPYTPDTASAISGDMW